MTYLCLRFPRAVCWTAFGLLFTTFLIVWHWFIYKHRASFMEWLVAMLVLVGLVCVLQHRQRSNRQRPQ